MKRPGEDVTVVAGDSDFAPGDVRYSFLVISHDARPVERALARVWVAHSQSGRPFESATARLETIGPPGAGEAAFGGVGRIYVVQLRITHPGRYWLVAEPVGGPHVAAEIRGRRAVELDVGPRRGHDDHEVEDVLVRMHARSQPASAQAHVPVDLKTRGGRLGLAPGGHGCVAFYLLQLKPWICGEIHP